MFQMPYSVLVKEPLAVPSASLQNSTDLKTRNGAIIIVSKPTTKTMSSATPKVSGH